MYLYIYINACFSIVVPFNTGLFDSHFVKPELRDPWQAL